jgi:hypothetical protein
VGDDPAPGVGSTDPRGEPTPRSGTLRDVALRGLHGDRPSRRETVLGAARHGFAAAAYVHVYAEYAEAVEEVMHAEQVPTTHRFVVLRYFDWIRPQAEP